MHPVIVWLELGWLQLGQSAREDAVKTLTHLCVLLAFAWGSLWLLMPSLLELLRNLGPWGSTSIMNGENSQMNTLILVSLG